MRYNINMIVNIEFPSSEVEVIEWAEFVTGYRGGMRISNPLCDYELQAESIEIERH